MINTSGGLEDSVRDIPVKVDSDVEKVEVGDNFINSSKFCGVNAL
jgi:hypothetical protein